MRIRQRALQGVIFKCEDLDEASEINFQDFNAARVERAKSRVTFDQKRRRDLNSLKTVAENPLFQRFEVNDDVGKLRHARRRLARISGMKKREALQANAPSRAAGQSLTTRLMKTRSYFVKHFVCS